MGLDLVIGHKGEDHITASDVAGLLKDIIGKDNYIFKLPVIEASLDQNQVTVTLAEGGSYSLQGRYIIDDYATETLTVAGVTTSGRYRRDAIIIRFSRTNNIESAEYAIKTGTESWAEESANPPSISSPSPESASTSEMIIGYILVSYTNAEYEPLLSRRNYQKETSAKPLSIQGDRFSEVLSHLTIPGSLLKMNGLSDHDRQYNLLGGLDVNQDVALRFNSNRDNNLTIDYTARFIKNNGWVITKSQSAEASLKTYEGSGEDTFVNGRLYGIGASIIFDIDKFIQYFDETIPESGHNPIESISFFMYDYTRNLLISNPTDVPYLKYGVGGDKVYLNEVDAVYTDTTFKGKVTFNLMLTLFQVKTGSSPQVKYYYKIGDKLLNYNNYYYEILSLYHQVQPYDSTKSGTDVTLLNLDLIGAFINGMPRICSMSRVGDNLVVTLPTIASGETCDLLCYDRGKGSEYTGQSLSPIS